MHALFMKEAKQRIYFSWYMPIHYYNYCTFSKIFLLQISVMCPVGSHWEADGDCSPCTYGNYQSQEGQLECIACPVGQTTEYIGSFNISSCFGKYSVNMKNKRYVTSQKGHLWLSWNGSTPIMSGICSHPAAVFVSGALPVCIEVNKAKFPGIKD